MICLSLIRPYLPICRKMWQVLRQKQNTAFIACLIAQKLMKIRFDILDCGSRKCLRINLVFLPFAFCNFLLNSCLFQRNCLLFQGSTKMNLNKQGLAVVFHNVRCSLTLCSTLVESRVTKIM